MENNFSAGLKKKGWGKGKNHVKKLWEDRVFDLVNAVIMVLVCVVIAYPLYYVLIASFTDPTIVNSGKILLYPEKLFMGGYQKIFEYRPIWTGYANTVVYTVGGTLVAIIATIPCAFALSRRDLWGRKVLNFLFTFTMFFSGGIIPLYLIINAVGVYDTIWAMILPTAVSVYNLIVCRSFFDSNIPDELYDASKIDGSNDFDFFFRIVIPLSSTIMAVMILFYATAIWNSFMNALMFMGTQDKMPLQVILRNLVLSNQTTALTSSGTEVAQRMKMAEQLKYAIIVVSALPLLVVYPFVQKYFAKGVLMGAVKG